MVVPGLGPDRGPAHRGQLPEADSEAGPAAELGHRVPAVRPGCDLDQGPGQPGVDAVQVGHRDGDAVPEQPGGRAHGHRVEPGQQRRQERGRPDPSRPDPGGQQSGQLGGAPAEPRQHHRVLSRHLDRDRVVPDPHRPGEGEADPLAAAVPGDQQRVVVDAHLARACAEHLGRAHHGPARRGGVGAAVAQLGQQLRPHHSEPAELDNVPAGQGQPDRERLGLGDRRYLTERDRQHAPGHRREHEHPVADLDLSLAALPLLPVRGEDPVLSCAHSRSLCLPARLRAPAAPVFPPRSSQAPRSSVQTGARPSARGDWLAQGLAGVPHSPQNRAPVSGVPQFPQNFWADGAAARPCPQPWQNLPPPVSWPQFGHSPVA